MQRTATTIGLGLAGALTATLVFAPIAFASDAPTDETVIVDDAPVDKAPAEKPAPAPFLDLLYAAPYSDLHIGDTTTVVIAQTVPAAYTLESYMSTGAKCVAPYDSPAADTTKSGTESDADLVTRTIASSGVDANNDGIDDHYAGTYDENGIAACKIKVTDEFGNLDWKYIYISVGLPKVMTTDDTKTPSGDDFDGTASTAAPVTNAPATATVAAAEAAPAVVADNTVTAAATLPRTGMSTWLMSIIGAVFAGLGAVMVTYSRRRNPIDRRHTFEF